MTRARSIAVISILVAGGLAAIALVVLMLPHKNEKQPAGIIPDTTPVSGTIARKSQDCWKGSCTYDLTVVDADGTATVYHPSKALYSEVAETQKVKLVFAIGPLGTPVLSDIKVFRLEPVAGQPTGK